MTQRLIPEWYPHQATWLAWPHRADLWEDSLVGAQREFIDLCKVIGEGETLKILVPNHEAISLLKDCLGADIECYQIPYGDIWLRDTAPIFSFRDHLLTSFQFRFNGWGKKYVFPEDLVLSTKISRSMGLEPTAVDLVTEGGAFEWNGKGCLLLTESCFVDENRNPGLNRQAIERKITDSLAVSNFLWLKRGILNDHTDGHIDTIARFIDDETILVMEPATADDPNREIFQEIISDLKSQIEKFRLAMRVKTITSPGIVEDEDGEIMPASYLNFYISNAALIVPIYGTKYDELAVNQIKSHYPHRPVIGLPAREILSGGGAFHCITQQIPDHRRKS